MNRTHLLSPVLFAALMGVQQPVLAQLQLQPLWSIAPGVRPYLTTGNTERGMAYNPVTGHVLLVSRAAGPQIAILDGTTGADLGTLRYDSGLITGGTLPISMIGVAEDGAIYAGNLTVNAFETDYRLYRWANETAMPTLAFAGTPAPGNTDGANNALRYGDTMDVRGAGASTQVILSSRGSNKASVLATSDGTSFSATLLNGDATGAAAGNGPYGLGLAFGDGNRFWGKSSGGTPLRESVFDLASGSAVTLGSFGEPSVANGIYTVAYDSGYELLVGINNVNHTVSIFDVSAASPILLDTEAFPVANPNVNGTGAAAVGGAKVFALDSNNGIVAFDLIPEPNPNALLIIGLIVLWGFRPQGRRRG